MNALPIFAAILVPTGQDITVVVPQADPLSFGVAQTPYSVVVFTAPAAEGGGGGGVTSWDDLEDKPTSFPPSSHKSSHATGGADALTPADIGAESAANKGQPGGYASLDDSRQIPAAQIPSIAITEYLGTVASEAAMLALVGQRGDWCVRTDTGTAWVITGSDPSILAGWTQFVYPAAPVSSVAGRTGAITLSTSDISGLGNSATRNVGTTAGTVAAGDDARLSDARTANAIRETAGPTILSVGAIADGQVIRRIGATAVGETLAVFLQANASRVAQVPTNTAVGGNARGANAVDLQSARANAAQVASGIEAFIGAGANNTASGQQSVVVGGSSNSASGSRAVIVGGQNNAASGANSTVSGGAQNAASGDFAWVPGGTQATTRGIKSAHAYSGASRAAQGDNQAFGLPVQGSTVDAATVTLTSDRASPTGDNVLVLPNNSMWSGTLKILARDTSGNTASWLVDVTIKRGANAASTTLVDSHQIRQQNDGMIGVSYSASANTTRGSLEIACTGIAGRTIDWLALQLGGQIVR